MPLERGQGRVFVQSTLELGDLHLPLGGLLGMLLRDDSQEDLLAIVGLLSLLKCRVKTLDLLLEKPARGDRLVDAVTELLLSEGRQSQLGYVLRSTRALVVFAVLPCDGGQRAGRQPWSVGAGACRKLPHSCPTLHLGQGGLQHGRESQELPGVEVALHAQILIAILGIPGVALLDHLLLDILELRNLDLQLLLELLDAANGGRHHGSLRADLVEVDLQCGDLTL